MGPGAGVGGPPARRRAVRSLAVVVALAVAGCTGGGSDGSGGSGGGAPRAKANTSATHGTPAATPTLLPEPAAVP